MGSHLPGKEGGEIAPPVANRAVRCCLAQPEERGLMVVHVAVSAFSLPWLKTSNGWFVQWLLNIFFSLFFFFFLHHSLFEMGVKSPSNGNYGLFLLSTREAEMRGFFYVVSSKLTLLFTMGWKIIDLCQGRHCTIHICYWSILWIRKSNRLSVACLFSICKYDIDPVKCIQSLIRGGAVTAVVVCGCVWGWGGV